MPIKPQSAKGKGRNYQKLVRDKIIELLKPYGVVAEDVKSTSMGAGGEDLQLSPYARGLMPISTECKAHKSMAVYKWYDQAKSNSGDHEPVLFIKADRKKPLVVVDMEHYLDLWETKLEKENEDD